MSTVETVRQYYAEAERRFKAGDKGWAYAYFVFAEGELEYVQDPVQYLALYLRGELLVRRYMLP